MQRQPRGDATIEQDSLYCRGTTDLDFDTFRENQQMTNQA